MVLVTNPTAKYLDELTGIVRSLQRLVRAADPGRSTGDEARAIVALFAEAERAATRARRSSPRSSWRPGPSPRMATVPPPNGWGSLEGSSTGAARGRLAAAERAARTPVLTEALHGGGLSSDQLEVVTKTSAEVSDAAATLLPWPKAGPAIKSCVTPRPGSRRPLGGGRTKGPGGPGSTPSVISGCTSPTEAASAPSCSVTRSSGPGSAPSSKQRPRNAGRRPARTATL